MVGMQSGELDDARFAAAVVSRRFGATLKVKNSLIKRSGKRTPFVDLVCCEESCSFRVLATSPTDGQVLISKKSNLTHDCATFEGERAQRKRNYQLKRVEDAVVSSYVPSNVVRGGNTRQLLDMVARSGSQLQSTAAQAKAVVQQRRGDEDAQLVAAFRLLPASVPERVAGGRSGRSLPAGCGARPRGRRRKQLVHHPASLPTTPHHSFVCERSLADTVLPFKNCCSW